MSNIINFNEMEIGAKYIIEIPSKILKRNNGEESEKDDEDSGMPKIKSVTYTGTFVNFTSNKSGIFADTENKQVYENGTIKNYSAGSLTIPMNSEFIAKLTKIEK